jgi:hypothetical protein
VERLLKKVTRIFTKEFRPPNRVDLWDEDGVFGIIVSNRFKGTESMDRVNIIWDLLEEHLTEKERSRIVTIVGVTPLEENLHSHTLLD